MWLAGCTLIGGLASSALSTRALPQEREAQSKEKQIETDQKSRKEPGKALYGEEGALEDFSPTAQHRWTRFGNDFFRDQQRIWTSPSRLRLSDANWLVPVAGISAGLMVTDRDFSSRLSQNPATLSHYKTQSNVAIAAMVGASGGMWLFGRARHNEHWRETGFLAGEAALNGLVAVEAMKYSFARQRPFEGDGTGKFFAHGTSFPSAHAVAAWSIAGVIAHEYPGFLSKLLAYGLASWVDVSRVRARQHFPSDVFVGSLVGNLIAQDVYNRHHDPQLGGSEWRPLSSFFRSDPGRSLAHMGSPYVPLDSWIYPALDRLIALGAVDSAFAGMKPWTRTECRRLLNEAADRVLSEGTGGPEANGLYRVLDREFSEYVAEQRVQARVESVYERVTAISGQPLSDGNHFAQTLTNDFGRPFQQGFNSVLGFSAWTTSGPWVGYVRAEYQHAPAGPALPDSVRQFIFSVDNIPGLPPATPYASVDHWRLLDAYVGFNVQGWQLSFGRQSLWWGPAQGGPMMFSDNAEPLDMFRVSRVSPFKLPSILGWLGPMRIEWFLGQFSDRQFVFQTDTGIVGQFGRSLSRQPFLQGQKLSFKPTRNFEFSVSTTTAFAGGPTPLTFHTLAKSYSLTGGGLAQGGPGDPGDRRSGVDFTYRLPKLRDRVLFYGEAFDEDEYSPLAYPRKSAYRGGIYLPRIPGIPKMDFRAEGGSTVPGDFTTCIGCFYVNNRYPDGSYSNQGFLLGSWLGRAGQGQQAWSTYWFNPRDKIEFTYRHQKVNPQYLPQGGTLNDGGVSGEFWLGKTVMFSASFQYEKWAFPVLDPAPRSNVVTSIGFSFKPEMLRAWSRNRKKDESAE
jgi:membrane-associated phospholipid phosphatase